MTRSNTREHARSRKAARIALINFPQKRNPHNIYAYCKSTGVEKFGAGRATSALAHSPHNTTLLSGVFVTLAGRRSALYPLYIAAHYRAQPSVQRRRRTCVAAAAVLASLNVALIIYTRVCARDVGKLCGFLRFSLLHYVYQQGVARPRCRPERHSTIIRGVQRILE